MRFVFVGGCVSDSLIGMIEEYLEYDEYSPSGLVWLKPSILNNGTIRNFQRIGKPAGSKTTHGYWELSLKNHRFYVHRIVWQLHYGEIPEGFFIDHIDGNTQNNNILNLRMVDIFLSNRNTGKRSHNTSGVLGVNWQTCNGILYARAQWNNIKGKPMCKLFSTKKLGKEEAFRRACDLREHKMKELQINGAGYTKRHIEGVV